MLSKKLSDLIEKWLNSGNNRTLSLLSKRANLPYSTLKDIAAIEVEKPKLDTTLSILNIVASDEEVKSILSEYYSTLAAKVIKAIEQSEVASSELLGFLGESKENFLIHAMASKKSGTTYDQIKEEFGKYGIAIIQRMLESGLLFEKNDRLIATQMDFSVIDLNVIKKEIGFALEHIDVRSQDPEDYLLAICHEGLNERGQVAVNKAIQKAFAEIQEIRENRQFSGDKTVFTGLFMGTVER